MAIVETVGLIIGSVLTLMIFSYLIGDNVLYRWALALLVGGAAGYAMAMAGRFAWTDWVQPALSDPDVTLRTAAAIFLLLGALLIFKAFTRRIAILGNIPLGYLVGAGAAVAVAGALMGTLVPQVTVTGASLQAADTPLGWAEAAIIIVGTIVTLLYFSARPRDTIDEYRTPPLSRRVVDGVGHFFIVVALGVAFAGAVTSALTTLVMRVWQIVNGFLGG